MNKINPFDLIFISKRKIKRNPEEENLHALRRFYTKDNKKYLMTSFSTNLFFMLLTNPLNRVQVLLQCSNPDNTITNLTSSCLNRNEDSRGMVLDF